MARNDNLAGLIDPETGAHCTVSLHPATGGVVKTSGWTAIQSRATGGSTDLALIRLTSPVTPFRSPGRPFAPARNFTTERSQRR
jgi:hypothetical protein